MASAPQIDRNAVVALKTHDGRTLLVRHMQPEDATLLSAMFWRLSPETIYRRFFIPVNNPEPALVDAEAHRLATIDPQRQVALITLAGLPDLPEAVAVARFARAAPDAAVAEGSLIVRDDYQVAGVGQQLFELLVQTAMAQGIGELLLITHADNQGVLSIVRKLGLPYTSRLSQGLSEFHLQLQPVSQ